jgi:uracil-DNA glycosylase
VDVREQLRRYLEQRREAGETELVLDHMTVEDVLNVIGAPSTSTTAADVAPGDWRAALRAGDEAASESKAPVERVRRPAISSPVVPGLESARPGNDLVERDSMPERPQPPVKITRGDFATEASGQSAGPSSGSRGDASAIPLDEIPTGLVVGTAAHELFGGPASAYGSLGDIASAVVSCTKCALFRTAKNAVPGEGSGRADLVCVGEAPGAVEDETGRPFVGPAGQLLDKILAAIKLSRSDVFICNVLKHRPPGNRNPMPDEVLACSPYLVRQIELLQPKVIVAFGTFAAQTLLNTKESIGKLRGRIHRYYGVPLVVTYHPAALLRNPGWKRPTWEDVQLARRLLDRDVGS